MKQIVLSLLVDNTPGVLSRVAGLFTRRGYNIDSISAGVTQNPKYTRITIVTSGDDLILEQIEKQLQKLEDVVTIMQLENYNSVCRELVLVKVKADKREKQEIIFSPFPTRLHKEQHTYRPKDAETATLTFHADIFLLDIYNTNDIIPYPRRGTTNKSSQAKSNATSKSLHDLATDK